MSREVELATDAEILASVRRGLPPASSPVLGTWKLQSYVRERLSDRHRHNQFGEAPDGYIGYAPDGRMYAIFTRHDRVAPRDVVPTDEEGVQLLGTMVAYAGNFSLGDNVVVHHIDISWNQTWTGTTQIRHFMLGGRHADDHHRALQKLSRRNHGPIDPRMEKGALMPSLDERRN